MNDHVHQAVPHGGGSTIVNSILAASGEEVTFLDLLGPDTLSDSDHPQELVDIITRVANQATKDDKHVVDFVLLHDRITDLLAGAHGLSDSGNVSVVPGVVVDQSRTVSHTADLVAVIPPGHDLGSGLGVLTEPLVGLAVVINNVLGAVGHARSQDNGWRRVGVGGDPGAVKYK